MTKRRRPKKKVDALAAGFSQQCQITPKQPPRPKPTPSDGTVLDDQVDPKFLRKWPKVSPKVPPIFLHKPIDFEQHVRKILNLGIKFYHPHLGKNYTKITCESFNDHKSFVQYLDKKQLPYHTFGNPSKRKMKVVIRGLPNETDLNKVKEELKCASIPIMRVHQMLTGANRGDNTILVLAVVPHDNNGRKILRLKKLLGHNVKLEPPNEKPRQCYRCQKWGHSQRYCHGIIKCVKCGGDHLTKKCEKPLERDPKCANCHEPHTANCRKCRHATGFDCYQMMPTFKVLIPRYKPNVLVTLENCHMLYKNVDYTNQASTAF